MRPIIRVKTESLLPKNEERKKVHLMGSSKKSPPNVNVCYDEVDAKMYVLKHIQN